MRKLLFALSALILIGIGLRADAVNLHQGTGRALLVSGVAPIDPSATSWKNAVIAAGGTVSSAQLRRVSTLISCYKTNSIWTSLDRHWLRAAENTQQANLDIVNLQTSTPHGSITFAVGRGYTGDGSTGYIDTNFVPSTAAGNFQLNSGTIEAYILTNRTTTTSAVIMGVTLSPGFSNTYFQPLGATATYYNINNNAFPFTTVPPTTAQGFWVASRTSSVFEGLSQNGVSVGTDTTPISGSSALANASIVVGALRNFGSVIDFSTDQFAADGIGAGMTPTQITAESACLNAYMASLSINVYASNATPAAVLSSNLASIFTGHAAATLPVFGVNTHTSIDDLGVTPITPAQNLTMAQTLGVSLVRIDAVDWQNVEASAGIYSYTVSDPYITGASGFKTAGMTVQLALTYSNTLYEASIYTGPTDSTGKTAYNNYVAAVVGHYGATSLIYELWNEPNIGCVSGGYAWSPSANATDYSTLATGGAAAAVGASASAKILTGGVAPTGCGIAPATFGGTMNSALTWTHFAGAALHPYNNGVPASAIPEQSITDSSTFAAAVTNAAAIYWSEVGYPVSETSSSETLKAVYDVRLVLSAVIAQAKQIALYQLASGSGFGLFDASFNILPAGTAYKNLITALTGCTTVDAYQYALQNMWEVVCHVSGGVRRIVWSAANSFVFSSAESSISTASAQDLFGNAVPVTISGNTALVTVTPNGGPVVLSVTN